MEHLEKVIDVTGLYKSFGEHKAVIDVSIEVNKGEIFGFLGPNGSGKTTTIRMLCGLLTPDAGSGFCLGYDIIRQSADIKLQVGYMPQHFALYGDLSIYENLEFIANIYSMHDVGQKVAQAIDDLGLTDRQNQLAGQLSGGWKQRLALAAALLHEPKLLLLDEPTAGVDPRARRDFWDHIHFLASKGITTLVSTHYMDEAERCNRLAYIMRGKILVHGTAEEIIQQTSLSTWEVKGPNLPVLAATLRQEEGVAQVISYGLALHVSGKNNDQLAAVAERYADGYKWRHIDTGLEDIFVNLSEGE